MLQVAFTDSGLRKDGSVVPRIVQRETIPYEEILAYMSKGSVVSDADMTAVMTQFTRALVHYLVRGKRVQTPLGAFSVHVRTTGAEGTQRTVSTNYPSIRIRPTRAIAHELRNNLQVSIVDTPPALTPLIYNVTNAENPDSLDSGKPGEILHLVGSRLSLDPRNSDQGVFFVAGDGVATRALAYSRLGSRLIDCKIPPVAPGLYTIEVRNQPGKYLRSGSYNGQISVTASN